MAQAGVKSGHVAVIDIGSNSVRLVVYERLSRAPLPRFNEKSLCGLGRELRQTGRIDETAAACAVNAVHRFCQIALAMDCDRIDLLATEALRRASNGSQVLAQLEEAAGRTVRILGGLEEAYFAARGVSAGFFEPKGLVGDLGGGSLDVAEVNGHEVSTRRESMPVGSLHATAILAEDQPKKAIDNLIGGPLASFMPPQNFYLVGGSWRVLARIHMAQNKVPIDLPHGYTVDAAEMRRFAKSIWRMERDELVKLPSLSNRRLPHVQGAALVLDRVLKQVNADKVTISSLGLREGWLFELLPVEVQALDPLVEGARAFGRPRARVPEFAQALARWTDELFVDEATPERRLREAVCELTDIAWADHRSVQAQLGMRRILQFPFVGIDHPGRAFMAACIHSRYGGDPNDPALTILAGLTTPARLQRAQILGRAMLTGHRISGSVPALLARTKLRIDSDAVVIEVDDARDAADSDAVRNRLKLLAKAIGISGASLEVRNP